MSHRGSGTLMPRHKPRMHKPPRPPMKGASSRSNHTISDAGAGSYCLGLRSSVHSLLSHRGGQDRQHTPAPSRPATQWLTTSALTAAMLVYALGAGITAAAGTRLALQLLIITVFGWHPFQAPQTDRSSELLLFVAASRNCVHIGQFARLLPALAVVAIFQAPSPESNPDSLSPVRAIVVHCTTVKADRSEVHVIKHTCCGDATNKFASADVPRDQPDSALDTLPLLALVFHSAGCNPPRSAWA